MSTETLKTGTALLSTLPGIKADGKKRKGNASKNKGKVGEREVADIFTSALGHPFQRIYCSGASVGRSNSYRLEQLTKGQGLSQLGDVMAAEYMANQFVLECKNYADLDFHTLLLEKCSKQLLGWYDEMQYDAESAITLLKGKKKPIFGALCVKITRKGLWIVVDMGMLTNTLGHYTLPKPYLTFGPHETREALKKEGWSSILVMCELEPFLEANKENLSKVNEAEYKLYQGGGDKSLMNASVEELEAMLAAKKQS